MNNKNNKSTKKSMVPGLIVLAAVMIFNLVAEASGDATTMVIAIVSCVVVALIVVITLAAVKKAASRAGTQERPVRPAAAPAARRASVFAHPGEQEEAIHCAHVRGKQKYIEQLDSYLKNGIIDKAEYRVLRERYEKLDLPDDYH